jgi:ribosomal protein S18 acetylase RimI-like enzyme
MAAVARIRERLMSPARRRDAVESATDLRTSTLGQRGYVVVTRGLDEQYVRTGKSRLPAWIIRYDASPELGPFSRLELESYRPGNGFEDEMAYANIVRNQPPEASLHVGDLHVPRARRGRGIGTLLVRASQRLAAESNLPLIGHLSAVDDTERLVAFYEGLGFQAIIYAPQSGSGYEIGEVRWPDPKAGQCDNQC